MKHKPLYRDILARAWQITWRHKQLWVLGLLAGLLQAGNVVEILVRSFSAVTDAQLNLSDYLQRAYPGAALVGLLAFLRGSADLRVAASGGLVFLIIALVTLLFLWVTSVSESALILTASRPPKKPMALNALFERGKPFGWRLVLTHFVSRLLISALLLAASLPLFLVANYASLGNIIFTFVTMMIFLFLALIISFMTLYTACGIVLRKERLLVALHNAWFITGRHFLVSLETAALLFLAQLAAGLMVVLFALLLMFPLTLLMLGAAISGTPGIIGGIVIFAFILVIALSLILGAAVATFQIVTWTLLYQRFSRGVVVSKIVRLLSVIPRLISLRL